ncbi:MAG: hypothetical protein QGI45_10340 [Myxococcota bacterium]|nr:hypothetical protein [Myxococcota bacterium]
MTRAKYPFIVGSALLIVAASFWFSRIPEESCFPGGMRSCECALESSGTQTCSIAGGWGECFCAAASREPPAYQKTFFSPKYHIDKEYKSMLGPQSTESIQLKHGDVEELLWISGFHATMISAEADEEISQEFMCHSNLDIDPQKHKDIFGWKKNANRRLFTLSQGQQTITFPKGFGVPLVSSEVLKLNTQVLQLNWKGQPSDVRHRIGLDYVRGVDLKRSLKPLFMVAANALVLVEGDDGYFNIEKPDAQIHGEGCLVGAAATKHGRIWEDPYGKKFSGHWKVPPGKQVNHTNVTAYLDIPFDTRVHYIAVHLHPFAESLELRDITTNKSVYTSYVRNSTDKVGLDHVDFYSSVEGLRVYRDHQYELISTYHNTSDIEHDSMAVMFLYLHDKEYRL